MKTFDKYYPESENNQEITSNKKKRKVWENLLQLTETATFHLSSISVLFVAFNISHGLSFAIWLSDDEEDYGHHDGSDASEYIGAF